MKLGILIKFRSKLYDQSRHSLYAGVMLNLLTAKLINFNFHPLGVVSLPRPTNLGG